MIAPLHPTPRPRLVCIDPGSTASGVVVLDLDIPSGPVVWAAKVENGALLAMLRARELAADGAHGTAYLSGPHVMVVEFPHARGMPASNDLFRTVWWIGRFREAWTGEYAEVDRHRVKIAMCGMGSAKDSNIRAALIDRFGGETVATARVPDCVDCHGEGETRQKPYRAMCLGCSGLRRVVSAGKPKGVKCPGCKGRGDVRIVPPRVTCHACNGAGRVGASGPLYGVKADCWQALAMGLTHAESSAPVGREGVKRA